MHHVVAPHRHMLLCSAYLACLHGQYRLAQSPTPWQRDFRVFGGKSPLVGKRYRGHPLCVCHVVLRAGKSHGDALQENTELRRQSEAAQERSTAAERRQQAEQHKQVLCLATAHPHFFAASLSSFWGCGCLLPNFSHV